MTYNFEFRKVSPPTIIYGCCFVVYALCYVMFTAGIGYFFIVGYSNIKTRMYAQKDTDEMRCQSIKMSVNCRHDEVIHTTVYVSLEKEIIRKGLIPLMVQWGVMTVTIELPLTFNIFSTT